MALKHLVLENGKTTSVPPGHLWSGETSLGRKLRHLVWNELEAWQDIEMDTRPHPQAFANEERGLKGEARVEREI